ncbi:MAG: hypothetical protein M1503_07700 [Thaumarchaeota archaeon]|nr:hypothetical protein [Nitrososphaerota archaeon]MCL5318126.1 hypothetical protein [Nitrososphaerota archaeon]
MSQPAPRVEEILKQVGVMDEIMQKHDLLTGIVNVVNSQGNMDKDTITYRLAMTIYHSKRLAGKSLITSLDDPGAIYLKAAGNPRLKPLIEEMGSKYKMVPTIELVKTLMCFLIASYIVGLSA